MYGGNGYLMSSMDTARTDPNTDHEIGQFAHWVLFKLGLNQVFHLKQLSRCSPAQLMLFKQAVEMVAAGQGEERQDITDPAHPCPDSLPTPWHPWEPPGEQFSATTPSQ